MSDQHDPTPELPELPEPPGSDPTHPTAEAVVDEPVLEDGMRVDPRKRPPDPAGTRPEWDPKTLLPERRGETAPGALWRPVREDDDEHRDDRERVPAGAVVAASVEDGGHDEPRPAAPRASRFSPRFQFALGALMTVAAAAIVLFVAVIAGRGDSGSTTVQAPPDWSAWHPTPGADGPTQIAEHVGRQYRLPNGKQLVAVTGGPLQIAGLPVTIAVRQTVEQGGDIKLIDGTGVLFRMCGLGPNCKIAEGKPSAERMMLLRREALELALYSFRYLGVTDATVFLPPGKGQKQPSQALFFRRGDADLQGPVSQPLDATLAPQTPTIKNVGKSPDAQLVDTLTGTKFFRVSFTQANMDARAFMVLEPLK